MSGLMFPKPGPGKKKRQSHPDSILHRKEDGTCFLCILLDDNWRVQGGLEEHHIFFSAHQRPLSEQYGLKVYLCRRHHQDGPLAVHKNQQVRRRLEAIGQQAFEERHGHRKFMEIFKKNYVEEGT